jgi:hypothetical protein
MTIFFISLLGSVSCVATYSGASSVSEKENETIAPQIIFLNYSIKLDKSKDEPEIILINKSFAEGKLKINNHDPEIEKPGDLKCIALNVNMEPVDSILISDPLNITVESVDDNNAFFKKEISLDSAQFSVRMQLDKKVFAIGMKKNTNSENPNYYLLITKIK